MTPRQCDATGKVRYRSELDALIALSNRAAKDKGEVRAYRCRACKGWHLTSMAEYDPDYRSQRKGIK